MVEHLKEAKTPVDDQLLGIILYIIATQSTNYSCTHTHTHTHTHTAIDKMGNLFSHSSGAPGNASSEYTASHHTTDMECTPSGIYIQHP